MKPLQLQIKGLNSFLEEQVIDFSQLTESGLFGIFGPTGSGKSSILDAITLALYGKVPRAGGQLNGIVNSQTDTVFVAYDFALGDGNERRVYRVQRSFKRNKNSGGEGVSTKTASVYDLSDENEAKVLLEGKREVDAGIETIIGLSAEDFTRSVVLPQDSFSEFLKMTGGDRAQMLERIFALEAYGEKMNQRIKQFKSSKYMQLMQLDSLLTAYENCSPENYNHLQEEIAMLRLTIEEQEKNCRQTEDDYNKYKEVWNWQEELKTYQQIAASLDARNEQMQTVLETLQNAEKAVQIKPLLEKVEQWEQSIHVKKSALAAVQTQRDSLAEEFAQTQIKWEKAMAEKDHDLPACLEKMHLMETALKLQTQIKQDENEHKELQTQYLAAKNDSGKTRQAADEIRIKLDQINGQLNESNQAMESLKIPPQLRERINETFAQERQYHQLLLLQEESQKSISRMEISLQENHTMLVDLTRRTEQKNTVFEGLQQEIQTLFNNCPGQRDDLLALQIEISKLDKEIEDLAELLTDDNKAKLELADIAEQIGVLREELSAATVLLDKQLVLLQAQQRNIENARDQHMAVFLAGKLLDKQACPVCGSLHHPNPAIDNGDFDITGLEDVKKTIEKQCHEEQQKIKKIEQQLHGLLSRQEIITQTANTRREKQAGKDLAGQQELRNKKQAAFTALNEAIINWEETIKGKEANLQKVKDELAELGKDLAAQEMIQQKESELLADKKAEALSIKANLQEIERKYQTNCHDLGLTQPVEASVREMQSADRALGELEKKNHILQTERGRLEQEKNIIQESLAKFELALAEIETSGREKRQVLDQKKADLQAICNDQKPEILLSELNQRIAGIEKNYQNAAKVYEMQKQAADRMNQEIASLEADVKTLETVLQQEESELKRAMLTSPFKERQEILVHFLEENVIRQRRDEFEHYLDQWKVNQANLNRVAEKIQGQEIASAVWEQLENQKNELQNHLAALKKQHILKEAELGEMKLKLRVQQELLNKRQVLDQEYGYIEDLEGLFKGKKFVDFIARTQLSYIAKEASRNLKDITRGRYALEINAVGEFVIRDDYNGGVRRGTHTLSGGETFLCSLALALALSSHIQLGRASLEFFFLDEGFGSLDPETLDIVIDSLESLHSEKLSVGVISHVEELKQRVPRRLIVSQAIAGISGSTVAIE